MDKWFLSAIIYLALPLSLFGNKIFNGDSILYLKSQDTIFLSTDFYDQKVFTHVMTPEQTLYSLSKFYGLTLDELYFYNPENEDGNYGVGSEIKIPVPNRSILRYKPDDYNEESYVPVYYIVRKGETLYHIANRIFKIPLDTLWHRNHLLYPTLEVAQKLHIGWMSVNGIPAEYHLFSGNPILKKNYSFRQQYAMDRMLKKEHYQKGAAVFIKGLKSSSDLIVMHRQAPVGSIIQITNPMKKRTVFAKVVAKTPPTYAPNIEVVVSPRVGKMLGAIDKKFYVKTKFLK